MRNWLVAGLTAVSITTSSVFAGGLAPVVVDTTPVVQEKPASSVSPLLILGLIVLIGIAVSQNDDTQAAISDIRLKTDITRVGTAANGLPLYHYRYIGLPMVYEGVMAQDVLQARPDAVITGPGGVLMVDYSKLGLSLKRIN